MKEYPCRTETVDGITYRVKIFKDEVLRVSTSYYTKTGAEQYIESMKQVLSDYTFEITEETWKIQVCIECGAEQ